MDSLEVGLWTCHNHHSEVGVLVGVDCVCHVCSSLPQKELGLPASQVLGLFNRIIRKFVQLFNSLSEVAMGDSIPATGDIDMKPLETSVDKELVSLVERGDLL